MKRLTFAALALLTGCASTPEEQQRMMAAFGAGLASVNHSVQAATYHRRNPGYYPQPVQQVDNEWYWDEFYNQSYQLVWACRGAQTGEFAEVWRCNGRPQSDWKWPQK